MTAVRPLPEPDTLEALVVWWLYRIALGPLRETTRARNAAGRYLAWVEACARLGPEVPRG